MSPSILFCATLENSSAKGWQRLATLRQLNGEVNAFDFRAQPPLARWEWWLLRLSNGQFLPASVRAFNQTFLQHVVQQAPEVIWIEKNWFLLPSTLQAIKQHLPHSRLVNYQTDNPFGKRTGEFWKFFIAAMPYYDLAFVIRPDDVINFKQHGAPQVVLTQYGFFADFFYPRPLTTIPAHQCHAVVFVGTALDHRVSAIAQLLKQNLPVTIYGNNWHRFPVYRQHRASFRPAVGEDYPAIVSGSKISLGFLSSTNLDVYTERSIDIPACGGFFLAERTPKHLELYAEGTEAEFFGSHAECVDKIQYYLSHETQRHAIAQAGYQRCLKSDYSLARVMREALAQIQSL